MNTIKNEIETSGGETKGKKRKELEHGPQEESSSKPCGVHHLRNVGGLVHGGGTNQMGKNVMLLADNP
jgi:hypothetical protein